MADPSLFPDGENIAQAKDYLSVQQQLIDIMRKQKGIYDDIGKINKDVEAKVRIRYQREEELLNKIKMQKVLYYEQEAKGRANMDDGERKSHKAALHSIRVEMKGLQDRFEASRAISNMEIDMAKKQHAEDTKWYNFALDKMREITGLEFKQISAAKNTGDEIIKMGISSDKIAYSFGAVLMMLKGAFDLFKKMDSEAAKFRMSMGMTRVESAAIRKDAEGLAIDYMSMGVTIEGVYKSYQAIGQAVGGVHNVTKDMARDVALMSSQLGVSEETSTNFMRNLASISKTSMESQTNMMGMAQAMSSAAGVNLGEVMADVAKASGPTLTMMSRLPNIALKSAIELRRMGTSLGEAAKSSRHMLNFTENMNEEMEASVLLGRSINLQHARELAYKRDLEGSTKEILRITKSVDFANLDVFQQEAFAAATGKSVDELMRMLQTDKQIATVKRSGTEQQKTELANYEKMRQENEGAAKARAKDAMVMLRTMANQERMAQLSNKWNQILAKAQQFLLPVLDSVLGVALALMDWTPAIMASVSWLSKGFVFFGSWIAAGTKIVDIFSMVGLYVFNLGGKFAKIGMFITGIGGRVGQLFGIIGKSFGFFGKFLGFFGKFLGPIGWVIMAFQAISGFISGWKNTSGNFFQKLFGGLVGILRGIIPGFDTILKWVGKLAGGIWTAIKWIGKKWWEGFKSYLGMWKAFGTMAVAAAKWIGKNIWEGIKAYFNMWSNIGSLVITGVKYLGGLMVNGIMSIGGAMLNAIISPFQMAWDWVKSLWGGNSPSQVGLSILTGIVSIGASIYDALTEPFRKGMAWIMDKIPGMGKFADKLKGGTDGAMGSVEKKAQAAYVPAVTVTPTGTQIETPKAKADAIAAKKEADSSPGMSEETGQKMVALLEKILAKDNSIRMDGQLLSSTLARQTEFKGGYGVNKV